MDDMTFNPLAPVETDAYAVPLDQLNPGQPALFAQDAMWPFFERLRRESPVHHTPESEFGPYWSITNTSRSCRWRPTTRRSPRTSIAAAS